VGGCRRRGRRLGLGIWCSRGDRGCLGLGVSASGGSTGMRAVVGKVVGGVPFMLLRLPLSIVLGITLSTSALSPWNRARFLTISFAKSRVPYCPSTMGCTKGCHSLSHNSLKLAMSLAAAFARESQTAPVKRLHSHEESSSLGSGGGVLSFSRECSDGEGGNMESDERATIASDCVRS